MPADARVDFLKVDVEGVESEVLTPATPHWMDRIDAVAVRVRHKY